MKVLHICKVFLPPKGGVQVVVDWLVKGLSENGVTSEVFTTYKKNEIFNEREFSHVKRYKSWVEILSMPIAPRLIFAIKNNLKHYDLACVHYPFPLADLAITISRSSDCKLVVYWHSEIVSQAKTSILVAILTKIMLRRASKIVCSSPNLIEHSPLLRQFRHKCVVIPFGMPTTYELEKELPKLSVPSTSKTIVFIGRHVPYKGIETLIYAFKKLCEQKKYKSFRLILIGKGPRFQHHCELVNNAELEGRICFLPNLNDNELRAHLREARCLVLPSHLPSEAFALVQLEAMALGRPIINTQLNSGVPWVARDGKEAITVKPNNAESLLAAITKICDDDELVDKLGNAARLRFNNEFTHPQFCQRTYKLFKEICEL